MKPLRGALVGYGFIASQGHMPAYAKMRAGSGIVEIAAVVDPCEARQAAARRDLPGVAVYADLSDLWRAQAGRLDFVDIATPPAFHHPIAVAALEQGLHVLCEKPLVLTTEEAADLMRRATQARRVVMPCHNYRHAPVVRAMRHAIDAGRIGTVNAVTLNTFRNTHAKGMPEWIPDWRRRRPYSGGGIAMDHGSHSFYICFDWLRAYPQTIAARSVCLREAYPDTEDNFSASLVFPTGLATVHLTWTAGIRKVIYTVQGERGGITAEDDDVEVAEQHRTDGPDVAQGAVAWKIEQSTARSHWMDASHTEWFTPVFDGFRDAIARDEFVTRDLIDAYMCVATIEAGYRSAADGCRETAIAMPPMARAFS